jgi:hypothetical protein
VYGLGGKRIEGHNSEGYHSPRGDENSLNRVVVVELVKCFGF